MVQLCTKYAYYKAATKNVHLIVCQGKVQLGSSGSENAWHLVLKLQLDIAMNLKLTLDRRQNKEWWRRPAHTHLKQSATVISKHKESDLVRQPNAALSDGTSMAARSFTRDWLLVSTWPVPAPYWNRWPATSSHTNTITCLCFLSSPYPCFILCLNKPAFLTTPTQ